MALLVVTLIGDDQAGLVDRLASLIADHGASWSRSHLGQLAGKFAGIVEVEVSEARQADLVAAFDALELTGLLDLTVETGRSDPPAVGRECRVRVVGHDQPGIVHELARALAERSVNIVELESDVSDAPMAGGVLFTAEVVVEVPDAVDDRALSEALDGVAQALAIDIDLVSP